MRNFTLVLSVMALLAAPAAPLSAKLLDRNRDPVALTGADLPSLLGAQPDRIVAFRRGPGAWVPVPVQVDERATVEFATIYNDPALPTGFPLLTYADSSTWTGSDPDPTFDADDELVFMAKEAGDSPAALPQPPGTIPGSGVVVTVRNPLNGQDGYVYLFRSDGSLDPGPGFDAVINGFYLLPAGASYRSQYDTATGPNPEDTQIISASYLVHFADRWICDDLSIIAGGASGVDILDRRKSLYAPGDCVRSEETFSAAEGALIVNRQGPVRVLRGYCGANSGPTTYRIHAFYESREDVRTVLRVHAIPSIMDFFDYSADATGMIYRNNLNRSGATIDGVPESLTAGPLEWEMVTGPQGTIVMAGILDTDIPDLTLSSYYRDLSPAPSQCTGDDSEYGASGLRIPDPIPNTDPGAGPAYRFQTTRVIAYDGPDKDAAFAERVALEARTPLEIAATPYVPAGASEGEALALGFSISIRSRPVDSRARVVCVLPSPGRLRLTVHDVAGRTLASLAREERRAGRHEFRWDASGQASGVYFVRAELQGVGARVTRFVLVR